MLAKTDVLIVGGGLAGLALAQKLHHAGRDFHLVEARGRLGGRILTHDQDGARYDMGPAWFWPGQPRMAALVQALDIPVFEQFSDGALVFEDGSGAVQHGRGGAMQGSLRLAGGMSALVDGLGAALPEDRLRLGAEVVAIEHSGEGVTATFRDGGCIAARHIVLALPPRVATQIVYTPHLPDAAIKAMEAVPTWMAGHAKAVVLYERTFWRDAGLSGDAMSSVGPMVEMHDASPIDGPAAIFGFIGVPVAGRRDEVALKAAVRDQMVRLFGDAAGTPLDVILKDWAQDAHTATPSDAEALYAHPRYGLPTVLDGLMEGRLILGSTETAPQFGGFLEGALEAAEGVFEALN